MLSIRHLVRSDWPRGLLRAPRLTQNAASAEYDNMEEFYGVQNGTPA